MDLKSVINSPGMWIASSIMIIIIVLQSVLFFRKALQAAKDLSISRDRYMSGIRSAAITSIGPAMGPVVILLALMTILGAPTTWMRMTDIGAGRTELAMAALATKVGGVELQSPNFDINAFSYAIWGMAFNNMGWIVVSLFATCRMEAIIKKINQKYDVKWVKLMMAAAIMGLFGSILAGATVNAKGYGNIIAAVGAAVSMLLISKLVVKRFPRMAELALGISMLIGMFIAAAL
ncbi:MAG: DUF5058 family protein [Negativicutes bacterium]